MGIAQLIAAASAPPSGGEDAAFYTGQIQSWDDATGVNSVLVNGTVVPNMRCLSIGAGIVLVPGDVVMIIRKQTQWFILGKVAAPGAGAALGVRQDYVGASGSTSSATYADLPGSFGPSVSTYISSARRALVLVGTQSSCINGWAHMGVEVSGASSMAAGALTNQAAAISGTFDIAHPGAGTIIGWGSPLSVHVYTAADGLNQGTNVFTAKYKRETAGGYTADLADFIRRRLVVIPF
ncbi:hypothetical protein [Amycolatopsis acidiphila]|uniref:hypothetical protein n=1 Tax=Amycolatopsis acidiphila TaxID=715473 RepID=UPI0017493832|nr:hypothetical protein [Amycolatopsis acidiphila]